MRYRLLKTGQLNHQKQQKVALFFEKFSRGSKGQKTNLKHAPSRTLFYFSCTLWLSSPSARRISQISTKDRRQRFVKELVSPSTGITAQHSRHLSGLRESVTSASARRTLRPSLFLHTAALQPGVKGQTRAVAHANRFIEAPSVHKPLFCVPSLSCLWGDGHRSSSDGRNILFTSTPLKSPRVTYASVFASVG